jgi:2-(1,2-epoxy-1,2-dihydrophenyl)acetyl-CoA isomerase
LADSTVTDVDADGSVTASRDGDVLRLTLDRPSRRNALSQSMIETFVDLLSDAATDNSLRAIHIRGAGSNFCAGADWWRPTLPANGPAPAIWFDAFRTRPIA